MGEPQRWEPGETEFRHKLDDIKYRSLFKYSPVSLWEEDLSGVLQYAKKLRDEGVASLSEYFNSNLEAAAKCASLIRITDINNATLELFEADSKEQFYKDLLTYFTSDALLVLTNAIAEFIDGKMEFKGETVTWTAKGNLRHLSFKTFILPGYQRSLKRVLIAITDITDAKIAEQKLKEHEQHFRSLIEASPSAILMLSKDYKILEFNPRAEFIYAKTRKEAIGQDYINSFLPEEAREPVAKDIEKVLSGIPTSGFINPVTAANGKRYVLEWSVNRLLDSSGHPVGIVAVGQDVTERNKSIMLGETLNEISINISSAHDVVSMIPIVAKKAAWALGAKAGNVLLKRSDEDWQVCTRFGMSKKFSSLQVEKKPIGHMAEVLRSKEVITISDIKNASDIDKQLLGGMGYRAFASIPLLRENVIGLAEFYFDEPHEFDKNEKDFIKKYSTIMALSVDNAYSFTETKQALEDSKTLRRIAARVSRSLVLEEVLDTALRETLKAMHVKHGCIYVLEKDKLVIRQQQNLTKAFLDAKGILGPGEGCAGEAAMTKEMFAPSKKKRMYVCAESESLMNLDCLTAAPIVFRGETLGVLELFAPVARSLTFREKQIVKAICDQMAPALQNARLFTSEKNVAKTLQEALLVMPEQLEGIEYGSSYRSATSDVAMVGGDFYDLFELDATKMAILIGDVSGKGLEAATLTSLIKNTIKAYAQNESSPAAILTKATDVIRRNTSPESFVTVFLGLLDVKTGNMVYCSAGHPPAIIRRKDSSNSEQLLTRSPALGVNLETPYFDDHARVQKDDVLVLFTDGIIEARHDNEFFGEERLLGLVKNSAKMPVGQLPDLIITTAAEFAGGTLSDDIAILTVSLS